MHYDAKLHAIAPIPDWLEPKEARQRLYHEISDFVAAAQEGHDATGEDRPAIAFKVTAGLGKTSTALRVLAEQGKALLLRGHVMIYMPTLDLAARAARDFEDMGTGLPIQVIRGRTAPRPENTDTPMCKRHGLVRQIQGLVPSITQSLCSARTKSGETRQAPCAKGCPYLAQKELTGTRIIFLAHTYLDAIPPIDQRVPVALRIIDEKVWSMRVKTMKITQDDFLGHPGPGFPEDLQKKYLQSRTSLISALQNGKSVLPAMHREEIGSDLLEAFLSAEAMAHPELKIAPWEALDAMTFRIGTFNTRGFHASWKRRTIFRRLAQEDSALDIQLTLEAVHENGDSRSVIKLHSFAPLPRDAPLMLLDADADPEITNRLAEGARFIRIEAKPEAEIVQVSDRTLSNSWLLDSEKGPQRRANLLTIIDREVQRASGNVLFVATKSVLQALHRDVETPIDPSDEAALLSPLKGAIPRWFGPRMQGVNDFEDFSTVIIAGRMQQPMPVVEADARALFGFDGHRVDDSPCDILLEQPGVYLMRDGTLLGTRRPSHPDPRARILLEQSRECGTLQAIARLRLVAPKTSKRVIVLSKLPLPGLPISRLTSWRAMVDGLDAERDPDGFRKLEAAFLRSDGQSVRGARLSKSGLTADLPHAFGNATVAAEFRRGRTTASVQELVERIAARNSWDLTFLDLRPKSGGRTIPAAVFADPVLAEEIAATLWPSLKARAGMPGQGSSDRTRV